MPEHPPRLSEALEGRYRIERELGEGGMATVYLAVDLKHKRKVAIKVLRPELAAIIGGDGIPRVWIQRGAQRLQGRCGFLQPMTPTGS